MQSESNAVFADDAKHVQQMGQAEQFPHTLADFEELQLAARGFGRGVEADEGAKTHAVHPGEIGQIQHNSFVGLNHRPHPRGCR